MTIDLSGGANEGSPAASVPQTPAAGHRRGHQGGGKGSRVLKSLGLANAPLSERRSRSKTPVYDPTTTPEYYYNKGHPGRAGGACMADDRPQQLDWRDNPGGSGLGTVSEPVGGPEWGRQ